MTSYFEQLKTVKHTKVTNTKVEVQPYTNSDRKVTPTCRKNIGVFKVLVYKTWSGNGFGSDSLVFVWNTETDVVKLSNDNFSYVVRVLEVSTNNGV